MTRWEEFNMIMDNHTLTSNLKTEPTEKVDWYTNSNQVVQK